MPFLMDRKNGLVVVEFGTGDVIVSNAKRQGEMLPLLFFGKATEPANVGDRVTADPEDVLVFRFRTAQSAEVLIAALQRMVDEIPWLSWEEQQAIEAASAERQQKADE